jgi:hypothetical protein
LFVAKFKIAQPYSMTNEQYTSSKLEGEHCIFRLINGASVTGIVAAFFPNENDNYFYVSSGNIPAFKAAAKRRNFQDMRKLCVPIDLSYITHAQRLHNSGAGGGRN